jgi:adenosylhomocysteine nucleosidase
MQRGEVEVPTSSVPAAPAALAVALKLVLPAVHLVPGVLGSANQVNREADRIVWIRTTWHAVTEDGESAHIAACAALLDVPAIGMRAIGDDPAPAGALALKLVESLP